MLRSYSGHRKQKERVEFGRLRSSLTVLEFATSHHAIAVGAIPGLNPLWEIESKQCFLLAALKDRATLRAKNRKLLSHGFNL